MVNLPPVDPMLVAQLYTRLEQKLRQLSQELPESIVEPRIISDFHYATICHASERVRRAILYEQVTHESGKDNM